MIRYAHKEELKAIYDIWKDVFAFDDNGYTDYLFKHKFDYNNTLVDVKDDHIVGIASRSINDYVVHNHVLKGAMIYGVATVEAYRNQGIMRQLMNVMLDIESYQHLVTFIQAYKPELYQPFGFEMLYYRQKYLLNRDIVPKISTSGCTNVFHPSDLLRFYANFVSHFNGYKLRDLAYFENYINEVKAQNGNIVAYVENKQFKGYAVLYDKGDYIEISECLYQNTKTLVKFVNLALQLKAKVELHVSSSEHLDKLFNDLKPEVYGSVMARINDYDLFNKLYNCKVTNVHQAFGLSNKPLLMIESI